MDTQQPTKARVTRQFGASPWVVQDGKRVFHHAIKIGDTVRAIGHPVGSIVHAETVEILADAPKTK